ncbi:MAG: DUF4403 family protein, partial [Desulfuromonadaceae bacterium]|nr:DUF4403 family protein [Desulfuromonadaceae bacterium]
MNSLKFIKSLIILLIVLLLLSACSGLKPLDAERPKEEAFKTLLKKEKSTINIPIEASSEELSTVLNLSVRKELYRGATSIGGVMAEVRRNGSIAVTASDNYIYLTIPIVISLSYSMYEMTPIPLKLKFKAAATVTPDWRFQLELYYQGVSDLLAEEVGVGPIKFKPRKIVESISQPVQKLVSNLIAQKINELVPLKTQITKIWTTAQQPLLLDANYNVWLQLTPYELMLFPLYTENNRVKLSVGIDTYAEMVVGPEPAKPQIEPLPRLKIVNKFDKRFRIALNTNLFYTDLRAIALPLLLNKKFDSDGKSITIKNFDLYGNGEKIVVKLETVGDFKGIFYLTGTPKFNAETNIFSIEDVDFDLQTEDILIKSADWLLHST